MVLHQQNYGFGWFWAHSEDFLNVLEDSSRLITVIIDVFLLEAIRILKHVIAGDMFHGVNSLMSRSPDRCNFGAPL